ncbi:hypothetical protein ACE1TI_03565 [Alteribacillus sp. JSM 102045]|uniref:hypothetical protein n=1 Tax=Alteribacillus sp. JSM 102045 TaxID=1562101 RepID=UPI0035BFB50F
MKKDKPEVSFKINGKKIDLEKEEQNNPGPPETQEHIQLDIEGITIADWKEKRAAEEEQAAAFWENEPKRPSVPYKKIRKKANIPQKPRKQKNQRKTYPLYFISLTIGAVALGLLFGIVMLQLFSENNSSTSAAIDMNEEDPPIVANFNDSNVMHVIQAGAFTKKAKGLEMQEHLHSGGYPAVLTHDGEYYYLFSGVSFNKEGAESLKEYYEAEGLEMYEKTRTMPEPDENGKGSAKNQELLLTSKQLLMDITEAALQDEEGQKEELVGKIEEHLEQTKNWEDEKAFGDLRKTIEEIQKEWEENTQATSSLQELLIESLLYYEDAVYAHNGEGDNEENTDTNQEPQ